MTLPIYVPARSTLVILFRIARARLKADSDHIALLTDARLIAATEEMHKIADEIRDAGNRAAATNIARHGHLAASNAAVYPLRDTKFSTKTAARPGP